METVVSNKITYLISFQQECGINWSYATEIRQFTELHDFTKDELKGWIADKGEWCKKFRILDIKPIITPEASNDKITAEQSRSLAIEFANWCMDRYIVNNAGRYMSKRPVGEHFISYTEQELFDLFLSQKQF